MFYIAFEGPDCCGKTTYVRMLVAALDQAGKSVVSVKQPGTTPLGIALEHVVKDVRFELDDMSERLLHTVEDIAFQHNLKTVRADYLVVDRVSVISNWAYSSGAVSNPELLWMFDRVCPKQPDIVIIPDPGYHEIVGRRLTKLADTGGDRIERKSEDVHRMIYARYSALKYDAPFYLRQFCLRVMNIPLEQMANDADKSFLKIWNVLYGQNIIPGKTWQTIK